MTLHMAGSPVTALASAHVSAATENFMALENHSADLPWWSSVVEGAADPIVKDGYIQLPETPGLGFTGMNLDVCREHLHPDDPGVFEPTEYWDVERAHDRLWS